MSEWSGRYMTWVKRQLVARADWYCPFTPGEYKYEPDMTDEVLLSACRGETTLCLFPVSEGNTCKAAQLDFDNKKGDPAVAEMNRERVFAVAEKYSHMRPVVEDSDGRGSYHLWFFFAEPRPAIQVAYFAYLAVKEYRVHEPVPQWPRDEFPRRGSVYRIPGRHHRFSDHVSRVWDGQTWLDWGAPGFLEFLEPLGSSVALPVPPPPGQLPVHHHQMTRAQREFVSRPQVLVKTILGRGWGTELAKLLKEYGFDAGCSGCVAWQDDADRRLVTREQLIMRLEGQRSQNKLKLPVALWKAVINGLPLTIPGLVDEAMRRADQDEIRRSSDKPAAQD